LKIKYLIDIRSIPYSKYVKQFNKEILIEQLQENGFEYRYFGNMVGGGNIRFHNSSQNIPKLKEFRNAEKFKKGITILHNFILQKKKIALMCSEKDPFTCHRFFLVSYSLQNKGVTVNHILYNGEIIKNQALEKRLKEEFSQKTLLVTDQKEKNLEDQYEEHYLNIFKKFSE